jgi:hypothetical protein
MALRPGDLNPLVCVMAGAHDSTDVAGAGLGGVIPNTKGHPQRMASVCPSSGVEQTFSRYE